MDMSQTSLPQTRVTAPMIESLRATKPWAMLLAILGFISIAFMLLAAVMMILSSMFLPNKQGLPTVFASVIYFIMAFVYIFPSLYLLRYSSAIGRFLNSGAESDMEAALSYQKSFWKFVGILSIVGIGIMILGVFAAIAIPMLVKMKAM